ncbi:O-methyltransferase [uncultured Corynebacterium sp.]|uniref:O-methyltransferase n=1 Tax=uncultured Corynebacterium sp. TaxID=159447 RepID=UPI0025CC296A|nr:O-methyltransferase [uncultured Corynebacterium sp.]
MNAASSSPIEAIREYVRATTEPDEVTTAAVEAAEEFGLLTPDAMTAEFLEFIATRAGANAAAQGHTPTGIIVSPASGVIGLHLFKGLNAAQVEGHLTCIEPEVQHQQLAKQAFANAGQRPNTFRFLPSAPLDVIRRLASNSYDIAVAEAATEEFTAIVESTLPALRTGGVLILLDSLMDGLVGLVDDENHADRQTVRAREADQFFRELDNAKVARLPLGAGATLITKTS